MSNYDFRTIDFRPAPPGWRIAYTITPEEPRIEPMPGWLIREEVEIRYEGETCEVIARTGTREVVAARMDEAEVAPATNDVDFWCVLGPGEPDPTPEEYAEELKLRASYPGYANRFKTAREQQTEGEPTA